MSVCNSYVPPESNDSVKHMLVGVSNFNTAVRAARIKDSRLSTLSADLSFRELIESIARFDSRETLTVAYIASHGSPKGLLLKDRLDFEGFFHQLEARTQGKVLLIIDSCYSGIMAEVLAKNRSARIFAITGTKGPILERWYAYSGSFSEALAKTIRERHSPGHDSKLTLGQLYDAIEADIRGWNARYAQSAGPISEPDFFGPRDLVVFEYDVI